jgi:hypothetical protein
MREKATADEIMQRAKKIASQEAAPEAALRMARAALQRPRSESIWDGLLGAFLRPAIALTVAAIALIVVAISTAPESSASLDDVREDYLATLIGDPTGGEE